MINKKRMKILNLVLIMGIVFLLSLTLVSARSFTVHNTTNESQPYLSVNGTTGNIEGEVNCKNIEISGKVGGKLNVSELLSLKASAKINGEIRTNKLAIEPGAVFSGTCDMKGNNTSTYNAEKPK